MLAVFRKAVLLSLVLLLSGAQFLYLAARLQHSLHPHTSPLLVQWNALCRGLSAFPYVLDLPGFSKSVEQRLADCKAWHAVEGDPWEWVRALPTCPLKANLAGPEWIDDACCSGKPFDGQDSPLRNPSSKARFLQDWGFCHCERFHPQARLCLRSQGHHGPLDGMNQCCYDRKGALITDPVQGGGTVDRGRGFSHLGHDVVPFLDCCIDVPGGLSSPSCQLYFEKRPVDDGHSFSAQRARIAPASSSGTSPPTSGKGPSENPAGLMIFGVFAGLSTLLAVLLPVPNLSRWDSFLMDMLAAGFSIAHMHTFWDSFAFSQLSLCTDSFFPVASTVVTLFIVGCRVLCAFQRSSRPTKSKSN